LALAARATDAAAAAALCTRLLAAFQREHIGVSIGVATSPANGRAADALINAADAALLDAKGRGKHRFSVAA
jgi:GGDEF domain-containing protein